MFTRLDYSSAIEYSIIRRYTNIVYILYLIMVGYTIYVPVLRCWYFVRLAKLLLAVVVCHDQVRCQIIQSF